MQKFLRVELNTALKNEYADTCMDGQKGQSSSRPHLQFLSTTTRRAQQRTKTQGADSPDPGSASPDPEKSILFLAIARDSIMPVGHVPRFAPFVIF